MLQKHFKIHFIHLINSFLMIKASKILSETQQSEILPHIIIATYKVC